MAFALLAILPLAVLSGSDLPSEPCQANQASTEEEHCGRFGNGWSGWLCKKNLRVVAVKSLPYHIITAHLRFIVVIRVVRERGGGCAVIE